MSHRMVQYEKTLSMIGWYYCDQKHLKYYCQVEKLPICEEHSLSCDCIIEENLNGSVVEHYYDDIPKRGKIPL